MRDFRYSTHWKIKRHWPTFVLIVVAVLLSGRLSAQSGQSTPLDDIVNIDLRIDIRLFTVMAALNAAGFDFEAPGEKMSDARIQVRRHLEKLDPKLTRRLRDFYADHEGADVVETQASYTSFALLLTGPPQFELSLEPEHMPEGTEHLAGFETLLSEFYQAAGIESLWAQFQHAHAEELISYRPVLLRVIGDTLDYLRMPPRVVLDRRIVLITDLLSYRNVVNARNLQKVYYLIVGPTSDPDSNYIQLQHEYLHFILDPMIDKFGPDILVDEKILEIVNEQPDLSDQYRGRMSVVATESLIEALQLRLHPTSSLNEVLVTRFRRGLVLTRYFYERLQEFEKEGEERFGAFIEEALEDLSSGRVEDDVEEIARMESEFEQNRAVKLHEDLNRQKETETRAEVVRLLNEAGQLTANQETSQAREKLIELEQLDPENPQADFYLAQIANQEGDFDTAYRYYQKAARAPDAEPWVRGWSIVRVGRYLASQGKFAEARTHFEQVLQLEGELQGAREVAEESLSHLPD